MFIIRKSLFHVEHFHDLKTRAIRDSPILIHLLPIQPPRVSIHFLGDRDDLDAGGLLQFTYKLDNRLPEIRLTLSIDRFDNHIICREELYLFIQKIHNCL